MNVDAELKQQLSTHSVQRFHASDGGLPDAQAVRKIGAGACGIILAVDGSSTVYKLAKHRDSRELENDRNMHTEIHRQLVQYQINNVNIPQEGKFIASSDSDFWNTCRALRAAVGDACIVPTNVLTSERIPPLPKSTRRLLIEKYCRTDIKQQAMDDPANRDCLVRVYLGSLRGRSHQRFFSLRNFKLHLNQMLELNLNVESMAADIGATLAVMHWGARTDARDVEFVLGSSDRAGGQHHKTTLWLLDFNQVGTMAMDASGVARAVDAFRINDPYYPRPSVQAPMKAVWDAFAAAYMAAATLVLKSQNAVSMDLPRMFLEFVEELYNQKPSLTQDVALAPH
ncbi:hypothetical protein ACHAQA_002674 [Verticillium albo-atrum]